MQKGGIGVGIELNSAEWVTAPLSLTRPHLQHVVAAAAMNVVRTINWLDGVPLAKARQSHFARLAPAKSS